MIFIIIVLLSSAVNISNGSPLLSVREKIVGGTEAVEGEVPWQVSIQSTGGYQWCSGSIISAEWLVTAEHCAAGINPNHYRVRSGSLIYNEGGALHEITNIIAYKTVNGTLWENDIALFRVDPPFVWDSQTASVLLPDQGTEIDAGNIVSVAGWGATVYQGSIYPKLLRVDVPIIDRDTCDEIYYIWGGMDVNQICAGPVEGGKGFCKGDDGGPLYLDGVLYGIVSWASGCASSDFPGFYTKVSAFRDWITSMTGV